MNFEAPDGGGGVVMGPNMQRLTNYVTTLNADGFLTSIDQWLGVQHTYSSQARYLYSSGRAVPDAFHHTSYMGAHGERAFQHAGDGLAEKGGVVNTAIEALHVARERAKAGQDAHARLMAKLPSSYNAAPDPSSPQYAQKGIGIDAGKAKANAKALAADQAAYKAQEAAIADAERQAAHHIQQMDEGFANARPPVRAIFEAPYEPPAGVNDPGAGGGSSTSASAFAPSYPAGSRSKVKASQARIDSTLPGGLYSDGMGSNIHRNEYANIDAAMTENVPEWDHSGMWVSADGSPSPASSYASVLANGEFQPLSDTAHGLSAAGMAGIAAGAAVATLGVVGAAKIGMFGGAAARAVGGVSAKAPQAGKPSPASMSGQRSGANSSSPRSGAPGGRGQSTTKGAGPGGRGQGKKDKKDKKGENTWRADTDEDWLDPNYKGVPKHWSQDPSRRDND